MKNLVPLTLGVAIFASLSPAYAQSTLERETKVASRIVGVTVYPSRAQVRRVAELSLPSGAHRLVFSRLPKELRADSVRVSASGVPGAVLHGFDMRSVFLGHPPVKEAESLEKREIALNDEKRALHDQRAVHQRHLSTMEETAKKTPEGLAGQLAKGRAQLSTWRELLVFMEQRQASKARAIQDIDRKLRDIDRDLKRVRAELAKLRGFRRQEFQQVEVLLDTPRPGKVAIVVEYALQDAGWGPAHDARLDPITHSMEWRSYGIVRQATGEHWDQVELALSTANPGLGMTPPSLPEWTIRPYEVSHYPTFSGAAPAPGARRHSRALKRAPESSPEMLDEQNASGAPIQESRAVALEQGTSMLLSVPRRVSIPSDGEPHQIPIGPTSLAAEIEYRAVPKYSSQVYLEMSAVHTGPWPLLPGPVKSFVGKDFVGTVSLDSEVPISKRFTLPMGIDRAFTLKRVRLAKQTGISGLLQKKKYSEYRYELTVQNHKTAHQTLRVIEPIPQIGSADITMTVDTGATKPIQEAPPHQLIWKLGLAPGEKKIIVWGYRVEWPLDMNVSGLE
ncbi:MAG: mucoidy inhibitor MuiA family protein [Candidatus Sericytochromatia bacterium]|nr:mucoidy inhibitor MuiA family protein [Candidatus Sericytochromatia bacterium]